MSTSTQGDGGSLNAWNRCMYVGLPAWTNRVHTRIDHWWRFVLLDRKILESSTSLNVLMGMPMQGMSCRLVLSERLLAALTRTGSVTDMPQEVSQSQQHTKTLVLRECECVCVCVQVQVGGLRQSKRRIRVTCTAFVDPTNPALTIFAIKQAPAYSPHLANLWEKPVDPPPPFTPSPGPGDPSPSLTQAMVAAERQSSPSHTSTTGLSGPSSLNDNDGSLSTVSAPEVTREASVSSGSGGHVASLHDTDDVDSLIDDSSGGGTTGGDPCLPPMSNGARQRSSVHRRAARRQLTRLTPILEGAPGSDAYHRGGEAGRDRLSE